MSVLVYLIYLRSLFTSRESLRQSAVRCVGSTVTSVEIEVDCTPDESDKANYPFLLLT